MEPNWGVKESRGVFTPVWWIIAGWPPGRSRGASVSSECWAGQRAREIIVKEQAETERRTDGKKTK